MKKEYDKELSKLSFARQISLILCLLLFTSCIILIIPIYLLLEQGFAASGQVLEYFKHPKQGYIAGVKLIVNLLGLGSGKAVVVEINYIITGLAAVSMLLSLLFYRTIRPQHAKHDLHGASRYLSLAELKKLKMIKPTALLNKLGLKVKQLLTFGKLGNTNRGLLLGRVYKKSRPHHASLIRMSHKVPLSVKFVAPPGVGKTVQLISILLSTFKEGIKQSFVVNDPKGEIYAATASFVSKFAKVLYVDWTEARGPCFNPISPENIPGAANLANEYSQLKLILEKCGYISPASVIGKIQSKIAQNEFGSKVADNANYIDYVSVIKGDPDKLGEIADIGKAKQVLSDNANKINELISNIVKTVNTIDSVVDTLVHLLVPDSSTDKFWVESGRTALSAAILFEYYRAIIIEGREPNLAMARDWFDATPSCLDANGAAELIRIIKGKDYTPRVEVSEKNPDPLKVYYLLCTKVAKIWGFPHRVAVQLQSFAVKADKERSSVKSSAVVNLDKIQSSNMRARISSNDLRASMLRGINGKPVVIYINIPIENQESTGILTGMYLNDLIRTSLSQSKSLADKMIVTILADEFHVLPPIKTINEVPALGRGLSLQLVLIGQSEAQITKKYSQEMQTELDNSMGVKIYATMNSIKEAEQVAQRIGNETIKVEQLSKSKGGVNRSYQFQKKQLITADQLTTLEMLEPQNKRAGEYIIVTQGKLPIRARPVCWFLDKQLLQAGTLHSKLKDKLSLIFTTAKLCQAYHNFHNSEALNKEEHLRHIYSLFDIYEVSDKEQSEFLQSLHDKTYTRKVARSSLKKCNLTRQALKKVLAGDFTLQDAKEYIASINPQLTVQYITDRKFGIIYKSGELDYQQSGVAKAIKALSDNAKLANVNGPQKETVPRLMTAAN